MPVPGIHVLVLLDAAKTWMAGTSAAMTAWDGVGQSGAMLACGPAASLEVAFPHGDRFVLERRRHRIVPAVEKTEQGYDPNDLDDLLFAPVLAQLGEHVVGHLVGHGRRRYGKIEGCPFRRAVKRARLRFPNPGELLVIDPEVQGAAGRVR